MPNHADSSVLTPRQRDVLAAICDTLVPEFSVDPDPHGFYATGARASGTAARVERLIGSLQDPLDRLRLGLVLSALESRFVNMALSGRFARFSEMERSQREAVLRGWARSHVPLRRAGF